MLTTIYEISAPHEPKTGSNSLHLSFSFSIGLSDCCWTVIISWIWELLAEIIIKLKRETSKRIRQATWYRHQSGKWLMVRPLSIISYTTDCSCWRISATFAIRILILVIFNIRIDRCKCLTLYCALSLSLSLSAWMFVVFVWVLYKLFICSEFRVICPTW